MNFCPKCGARIMRVPGIPPRFCAKCGAILPQEEAPKKRTLLDNFPFRTLRPSQLSRCRELSIYSC